MNNLILYLCALALPTMAEPLSVGAASNTQQQGEILIEGSGIPREMNLSSMIGVEFKTGMADQGVPVFDDITFGVSGSNLVSRLNLMKVNCIVIPVPEHSVMSNQTSLIAFVQKIRDSGGHHFNLILSRRKWNLHLPANQAGWAQDIANAYNALDGAGLADQVTGFRFDENTPLHGAPSTEALWNARHDGVLSALDVLAGLIGSSDLKFRSVFIHGKGYGSQFKGVKASSDGINFPQEMNARCRDYAYSFKWFQEGTPTTGNTLADWENHFRDTAGFSEVHELGRELVFSGDAGDGLRADILNTTTKATAMWNVFQQYGWSSTFFGPFLRPPEYSGRTILHYSNGTNLSENTAVMDSWEQWHAGVDPYTLWAAIAFAGAPEGTDISSDGNPDGDEWSNMLEWLLICNPLMADQPATDTDVRDAELVVTFDRRRTDDAAVRALWCSSLVSGNWDSRGVTEVVVCASNDVETVAASVPMVGTNAFIRIEVAQ